MEEMHYRRDEYAVDKLNGVYLLLIIYIPHHKLWINSYCMFSVIIKNIQVL